MKKTSAGFVGAVLLIMLLAGLAGYWGTKEQAAPPSALQELDGQKMTLAERALRAKALQAQRAALPPKDDPNAPPFHEELLKNVAATTVYIEKGIMGLTLWKLYERCTAENQAAGLEEKAAHRQCVVLYNRALSEHLDFFFDQAIANEKLTSFYRLQFYPEEVYGNVNRILLNSNNVIERLVALKLIERSPLIFDRPTLSRQVYENLESYTHPELTLILDPRYEIPLDDTRTLDILTKFAVQTDESIETANRAVALLGKSGDAERVVGVVDTVLAKGWDKTMYAMPKGIAVALGSCGEACLTGFEDLAHKSEDQHGATLLYLALMSLKDPEQRRRVGQKIESILPPLETLSEREREQRSNAFAAIYK